jgi:uncharacterized membrane protein
MGQYNDIAGRSLERVHGLSDGLFSIAMTLIVLEIHVPAPGPIHTEAQLIAAITALAPQMLTYVMSFTTLGIFWIGQQTHHALMDHSDRVMAWMQIAFLAVVALMPLTTELLGEFITFRTALVVYWLNILLLGAALLVSLIYAERAGLLKADVTAHMTNTLKRRIVRAQALYALGALLCVFNTYWSIGFIVLVQLNYVVGLRTIAKITG